MSEPFYLKKFLKELGFHEITQKEGRGKNTLKWKRKNILIERYLKNGFIYFKVLIDNKEIKKFNISSCLNNELHKFKKYIETI